MTSGGQGRDDEDGRDRKVVDAYRAASDALDERASPAVRAAILAAAARAVETRPRDAARPWVSMPDDRRVAALDPQDAAAVSRMASAGSASDIPSSYARVDDAALDRALRALDTAGPQSAPKPRWVAARRPLAMAASFLVASVALVLALNVQRDPAFDDAKPARPAASPPVPAKTPAPAAGTEATPDVKAEAEASGAARGAGAATPDAMAVLDLQKASERAVVDADAPDGRATLAKRDAAESDPAMAARADARPPATGRQPAEPQAAAKRDQATPLPQQAREPGKEVQPLADAGGTTAPASVAIAPPVSAEKPAAAAPATPAPPPAVMAAAPAAVPKLEAPPLPAAAPAEARSEMSHAVDNTRAPASSKETGNRDATTPFPRSPVPRAVERSQATTPAAAAPDAMSRLRVAPALAPSTAGGASAALGVAADRSFESDPTRWAQRVVALRAAGRDDEADRELVLLRARYPSVELPAAALPRSGTR